MFPATKTSTSDDSIYRMNRFLHFKVRTSFKPTLGARAESLLEFRRCTKIITGRVDGAGQYSA